MKKASKKDSENLEKLFSSEIDKKDKEVKKNEYFFLKKELSKLNNLYDSYDYIKISVASPEQIKSWDFYAFKNEHKNYRSVYRNDTLSFKLDFAIRGGLFCPYVFGPEKSWDCRCGKVFKRFKSLSLPKNLLSLESNPNIRYFCKQCRIELTDSRVRRYRMGYHQLSNAVAHFWYYTGSPGNPNYIKYFLEFKLTLDDEEKRHKKISQRDIDEVLYNPELPYGLRETNPLQKYILPSLPKDEVKERITNLLKHSSYLKTLPPAEAELEAKLTVESSMIKKIYGKFQFFYGGELLLKCIETITLETLKKAAWKFRSQLIGQKTSVNANGQNKDARKIKTNIRNLKICESFTSAKIEPKWIILTLIPILPPELRKIFEMSNGQLVSSDLNDFYRIAIMRNNTLEILQRSSRFADQLPYAASNLQRAVDGLLDNARSKESVYKINDRVLTSLTERLEGKEGRFRLNLFGKRINYSGRSVIVSGPALALNQCGLPYKMAKTLFKPLLDRKILELPKMELKRKEKLGLITKEIFESEKSQITYNPFFAKFMKKLDRQQILELLELLGQKHSILINRAPTLHKFGVQSFQPLILLTKAIQLHPLVCSGFNADFDGDQVGIYLPFLNVSQLEIQYIMKPSDNIFSPGTGGVILTPTQDMVIGTHYLTSLLQDEASISKQYYSSEEEILVLFYQKKLSIHTRVLLNYSFQNGSFEIQNNQITFFTDFLPFFKKKIIIKQILYSSSISKLKTISDEKAKLIYLLTNVGILVAKDSFNSTYELTDLFVETTPGRLLFEKNIKENIQEFTGIKDPLDIDYKNIFYTISGQQEIDDKERENLLKKIQKENWGKYIKKKRQLKREQKNKKQKNGEII